MAKRTDRHYTVLRQIGETVPPALELDFSDGQNV